MAEHKVTVQVYDEAEQAVDNRGLLSDMGHDILLLDATVKNEEAFILELTIEESDDVAVPAGGFDA